jgi:hypothetical protein
MPYLDPRRVGGQAPVDFTNKLTDQPAVRRDHLQVDA